jgi:hypothetical protein
MAWRSASRIPTAAVTEKPDAHTINSEAFFRDQAGFHVTGRRIEAD